MSGLAPASRRGQALVREGIQFHPVDVRDAAGVERAIAGHEVVIHLAGAYRKEGRPLREFHDVNVTGTQNVLAAARAAGVERILHVSTTGVYGNLVRIPADETHPYGFTNHYQQTKLEGEKKALEAFHGPLRGRGVVIRPAGVYGPHDMKFLKMIRLVHRRRAFYVGPCTAAFHPTYIDDFLDGLELARNSEQAAGEAYNIAGASHLSVREYIRTVARALDAPEPRLRLPLAPLKVAAHVCEKVCRLLRVEPPLYPRRLGFFHVDRAYSIEKARRQLGYRPQVSLEAGLSRSIAWYRQEGLL